MYPLASTQLLLAHWVTPYCGRPSGPPGSQSWTQHVQTCSVWLCLTAGAGQDSHLPSTREGPGPFM